MAGSDEAALGKAMSDLFMRFKLHYYCQILRNVENRSTTLSTDESYFAEVVYSLGMPTIGEVASFVHISPQNAAYKVNRLVEKGYITKEKGPNDKRETRLKVTERFMNYYNMGNRYIYDVAGQMEERFSPEEIEQFVHMLNVTTRELPDETPAGS